MSLSYPLTFPTAYAPREVKYRIISTVGETRSPFSGSPQYLEWDRELLLIELGWPLLARANGQDLAGFIASLHGKAGSFLVGDPKNTTPLGVATGTPVYSDIARDHLLFDGVDDAVTIPHNAAYNSNNLTVEFWMRGPTVTPGASLYLASKWDGSGNDKEFAFQLDTDSVLRFAVSKTDNTGDVAVGVIGVTDGKWHHIAGVKAAGGALTLYVDGVVSGTGTLGQEGDQTTHVVRFGNRDSGASSNAFAGPICECRIWNTARTLTQIRDNMSKQLVGNETNLVGYWRFDDGSGTVLDDLTSTANNGTVNGAAWARLAKSEMLTAGWTASQTGILKRGDWFQLGSGSSARLRQVTQDCNSNAAGVAHVDFSPKWSSEPADQASITTNAPKGSVRLASNEEAQWAIRAASGSLHEPISLTAVQDP